MRRAVGAILLAAGCHRPPNHSVDVAVAAHTFGDTTAYASRIISFDAQRELLVANFKNSSYVILLAVIPGKSIEQISPSPNQLPVRLPSGKHSISVRQTANVAEPDHRDVSAAELGEINRCVAEAMAVARRRAQAQQPVKRDSLGRIVKNNAPPPVLIDEYGMENACRLQVQSRTKNRPQLKPPIREPAERYLVVLTSPFPIAGPLISDRLESLLTTAPDVATTIEAIAQGLFAGMAPTWSGTYTTW